MLNLQVCLSIGQKFCPLEAEALTLPHTCRQLPASAI